MEDGAGVRDAYRGTKQSNKLSQYTIHPSEPYMQLHNSTSLAQL